jgi:spermidine synthase
MFELLASIAISDYQETFHPEWKQTFSVEEMIYEEKSDFWDLAIFENSRFGRVLAIDGTIQVTEKDAYVYHEMIAHVPILAHSNAKSVLIIGGGDGALLREVLKHDKLERIVQVEIDPTVIEISKKYLPNLSQGSLDNPRATIVIQDAIEYVKEAKESFDIIICDSTDPEGPAAALFTSSFYGDCKKLLNAEGIFVTQSGVPFIQEEEFVASYHNRKPHFKHVSFFIAPVPTYVGGFMAFGWASDTNYKPTEDELRQKMGDLSLLYYTPQIHLASFALPQFMLDLYDRDSRIGKK